MKIHNFVLVGMALWQLSFAVCADEDTQAKESVPEFLVFTIVPVMGVMFGHLQVMRNHGCCHPSFINRVEKGGGFVSGNFGTFSDVSEYPWDENDISRNRFFSASIGHFSISNYENSDETYELQLELEYLQDVNTLGSEEVDSFRALLYNFTGHWFENFGNGATPLYISFGAGWGKLDLPSLVDTGFTSQLRIGLGPKAGEKFRLNFGYRGVSFRGNNNILTFHRLEAGGEYKW